VEFRGRVETEDPVAVLEELAKARQVRIRQEKDAGRLDRECRDLLMQEMAMLDGYRARLQKEEIPAAQAMDAVRSWFGESVELRGTLGEKTGEQFANAFRFLEETFRQGQELVLFVTEVTAGYDTSWFVENFGCDAYFRHNKELLFDATRQRLSREILELRKETVDE
jgi:hypothetical protein